MSKHQVAVLKVVSRQLSVTAAADAYGISRQDLHSLLRRYRDGGLDAIRPRSRRPHTNPGLTSDEVRGRIVELRTELDTGEILSSHRIEPHKGYWRNTRRDPGRWPRSRATE